jgi:uncharacterized protein YggE
MRIVLPSVCAALAAGLVAGPAPAADPPAKADRMITVTGTATVYAKPDVARVYYGIRVQEPSVDAVKDVIAKMSGTMDEGIKKLKLANLKVTSAPVSIQQSQGNNNAALAMPPGAGAPAPAAPGLGPFVGHTSHTATIADADPDKLRAAVDAFVKTVVETGANTSGDIRDANANIFIPGQETNGGPKVVLSRSDDSAAREEALQKAVDRAVKNAKAIAKALGGGEVKVVAVEEGEPEKVPAEGMAAAIYGLETSGSHKSPAGEVEVKVRVVVKCAY